MKIIRKIIQRFSDFQGIPARIWSVLRRLPRVRVCIELPVRRAFLRRHSMLSLSLVTGVIFSLSLIVASLYYQEETVTVLDGHSSVKVQTKARVFDAEDILLEAGLYLGEFDTANLTRDEDGQYVVDVTRSGAYVEIKHDDSVKLMTLRAGETVATALYLADTSLDANDLISRDLSQTVSDGTTIVVTTRNHISVGVDGEVREALVEGASATVADALVSTGVVLGAYDYTDVALDSQLYENLHINVRRVTKIQHVDIEELPFETEYVHSNLVKQGREEVISGGVPGRREVTAEQTIVDGVLVNEEIVSDIIASGPVNEIVGLGKALQTPYSKRDFSEINLMDGIPASYSYVVSGKACAYTAPPGAGTASGRKLQIGTIAVNPDKIPYGSLLYIVSQDGRRVYGAAVAADTGAFTDDIVADVYMGTTSEHFADACDWGAQYVDIYVISTGNY